MTDKSTLKIKFSLYNVENLFLLFDHPIPENFEQLSEPDWQKLSSSVYYNKPLRKCLEIAKLILKNDPDIVMLCEVGGLESLKNFSKFFLDSSYSCVLIEGNSDRNIDIGYLIKKNQPYFFDIISNKNRPLNFLYPHELVSQKHGFKIKSPSQTFSRDCAELRLFKSNRSKPFLIILLTHLKSRLDPEKIDPGGSERRAAELKMALVIYKELEKEFPTCPILFCGDLNGYAGVPTPDSEFLPLYQETDLQDVLEVAGLTIDNRYTFYQIKNGGKVEGKQIDYCFLPKKAWPNLIKQESFVYRYTNHLDQQINIPNSIEAKGILPSDHYPLFFTLENIII